MRGLELACSAIVAVWLTARALGDAQPRRVLLRYLVLAVAGFLGEDTVIRAYGFYFYSLRWDLFLDRVPLFIVIIWPVVIHSAWDLARRLCGPSPRVPLVGAAIVLADAALIEPIAVQAGLWRWTRPGLFSVPPIGILGWALFALAAIAALERARPRREIGWRVALIAPALVHPALLASWWILLRWLSQPLPSWLPVATMWTVTTIGTMTILRRRLGARVPLRDLLLRAPGAAFFFVLLVGDLAAEPLLGWYAVAFVPPYIALVLQSSTGSSSGAREKNSHWATL